MSSNYPLTVGQVQSRVSAVAKTYKRSKDKIVTALPRGLLQRWQAQKLLLENAKAEEMRLRQMLVAQCCAGVAPDHEGKIVVADRSTDNRLEVTFKLNRQVDEPAFLAVMKNLTREERACVRFTPELVMKKLRALEGDSLLRVQEFIIAKPGTPSIEFVGDKDTE